MTMALIGDGPLRLPVYSGAQPAVLTITCPCRRRYVLLTGAADAGMHLIRREAERRGALYVDARVEPFILCACNQVIDLTVGAVCERVM
jgi:hypothetical protein